MKLPCMMIVAAVLASVSCSPSSKNVGELSLDDSLAIRALEQKTIQAILARIDTSRDFVHVPVEMAGRGNVAYSWATYSIALPGTGVRDTAVASRLAVLKKLPDGRWVVVHAASNPLVTL